MDRQTKAINEAKSRTKIFIENGWTEHEAEIFIKGFVEGSDWSIESAYHQPGDIPEENEMILCETKDGPMIAGPFHKDFNDTVEHFGIKMWAYTNDLIPGVVAIPEKKNINPKYNIGQSVVIKSEEGLRKIYGEYADLRELIPYVNKVVTIRDLITIGSNVAYEIREYHQKAIHIAEDAILCDANDRSWIEPLECPNVQWDMVAPDAEMAKLDTIKLNHSPMEEWKCIYKRMKKILSSASPELRAFASGQLLGLSEQFMPCSSPVIMAENKENCDSTVYIALAEDVEKYPKYVRGENFLSGTFVLKEGKSFIGYRFYKWNVVFHSVYLGLTSDNRMKGFTVTMKMYVGNYPKSFVKEIFNRFLGKDVVVLFKEDSLPYYRCLYRRSGNSAVLDYQENGIDPTCFSVTASPIESPDMLLEEKDFSIEK